MTEVAVPWGADELRVPLPGNWTLQQVAAADLRPAPQDWAQRLAVALDQPGTGPPMSELLRARRNGRIVVVVEDVTRGGPLAEILAVMMREIRFARIPDDRIEVVFATGSHPQMAAGQVARKLGLTVGTVRWRCNRCRDRSAYVHVGRAGKVDVWIDRGVARADLRIIVSSVSPHFQAGFGGGYRLLVPGCAHIETISALGRVGMERSDRPLVGQNAAANPLRATIDEGGRLVDAIGGKTFAVQYLLDGQGHPASIAAGQVIPTQQMLAKQCSVACGILVETPADVLITNAHPRTFDLGQSLKCIANTRWAVRPNGVIICLTDTKLGLRDIATGGWPFGAGLTRRLVRLIGPEAVYCLTRRAAPGLIRDAAPYVHLAARILYRNPVFVVAPALHAAGVKLPGLKIFATVEKAIAAAAGHLGPREQRAIVFPVGGTTFPILSALRSTTIAAD